MTEENPFYKMELGYLNALMATVTGTDQQAKLAKEYLKDVDPDIWHDQLDKLRASPHMCGGNAWFMSSYDTPWKLCGLSQNLCRNGLGNVSALC